VPLPPFHQKYRKVITYRLNLQPLKQSQQACPKLASHFLIFLCDLCIGYMEFLLVAVLLLLDLAVQMLEFEVHEAFDFLLELGLFGATFIIFVDALTGGTERMRSDESADPNAAACQFQRVEEFLKLELGFLYDNISKGKETTASR
jgi:hypothetical protein